MPGDCGYTLEATFVAYSGGEWEVQVVLHFMTWAYVSDIPSLRPHHVFLLKPTGGWNSTMTKYRRKDRKRIKAAL